VRRTGAKNDRQDGSSWAKHRSETEGSDHPPYRKLSETRLRRPSEPVELIAPASSKRPNPNAVTLSAPERRSGPSVREPLGRLPVVSPPSRPLASWIGEPRTLGTPEEPSEEPFGSELFGATLLSAIAGYVDAAGFLSLFGMFTAHITGDLVAGSAIAVDKVSKGFGLKIAAIPIFMASVAVATLLTRAVRRRGGAPIVSLLALMTGALAVFCAAGVFLRPFMVGPDNWAVAAVGSTGVAAMAIQNMLMRDALSGWSPTTIMTGNLTRVSIHMVEYAFPPSEADTLKRASVREEATSHLLKFGLPLLGFVAGASLSAWLTRKVGLLSIALPTVVVGLLTLWQWRRARSAASDGLP